MRPRHPLEAGYLPAEPDGCPIAHQAPRPAEISQVSQAVQIESWPVAIGIVPRIEGAILAAELEDACEGRGVDGEPRSQPVTHALEVIFDIEQCVGEGRSTAASRAASMSKTTTQIVLRANMNRFMS
jgi:hypothetical protein